MFQRLAVIRVNDEHIARSARKPLTMKSRANAWYRRDLRRRIDVPAAGVRPGGAEISGEKPVGRESIFSVEANSLSSD